MAQKTYISLDKLTKYHEKEVARVNGLISAAKDEVKEYAEGLGVNYDVAGAAATVQGNLDTEVNRAKAREDEIAAAATKAQEEVDALETLVGTLPEGTSAKDVVDYVNVKTAGIATDAALAELQGQVTGAQNAIDAIEADYLKAADKQELADAIAAEAEEARAAEKANADAIDAIEADYLKAADKEELQGGIDTNAEAIAAVKEDVDAFFKDADMTESAKDTLKELQAYIASDETAASEMLASIQKNAQDISAEAGKVATLQGEMDAVEKKAADNEAAIAALQGAVGDGGSVEDMIAEAVEAEKTRAMGVEAEIQADADKGIEDAAAALAAANAASTHADELNTAMNTRVASLETASATHALKTEVEAVAGRVTTVEGKVGTLETEMDAVEAKALANEGAIATNAANIAKKADASALETAVGRIDTLEAWHTDFVEASEADINGIFA